MGLGRGIGRRRTYPVGSIHWRPTPDPNRGGKTLLQWLKDIIGSMRGWFNGKP